MEDRWVWNLENSGLLTVSSLRKKIDAKKLARVAKVTRWIKFVPIKVNVLAWKVMIDALHTRLNISRRGIGISSLSCPICDCGVKSTYHLFSRGTLVKQLGHKVLTWWNLPVAEFDSYVAWKAGARMSSECYVVSRSKASFGWNEWLKNPSIISLQNQGRVTDEEPELFRDDELSPPPDKQRIAKSQRSTNSSTSSGSNPTMFQDMLKQQYELDRASKMKRLDRETSARVENNQFSKVVPPHTEVTISVYGSNGSPKAVTDCIRDVHQKWIEGGNYELSIEDVRDEIWDMVKPADPLRITLSDLLAFKQGVTIGNFLKACTEDSTRIL
nr:RNA-directed DNA polymerase, eukaryota [Tanacetum cinerariifolium]